MSRLADARAALAEALEPCLAGRVYAYPQQRTRWVAPAIYVEQASVRRARIGQQTTVAGAVFPVWITADGTDRAQVAAHDDIVSAVWDACFDVTRGQPADSYVATVDIGGGNSLRATVVSAEVNFDAITLCPPTVTAATIPPVPVTT